MLVETLKKTKLNGLMYQVKLIDWMENFPKFMCWFKVCLINILI